MADPAGAAVRDPAEIRVLHVDDDYVPLPGPGDVRAVIWPGMGAQHRSMHVVRLSGGESSGQWRHPSEAVYYIVAGTGWFEDRTAGMRHSVHAGLIVHVDAGTAYTIAAQEPLVCVGGPCPPDPALYTEVRRARG